jgi:hypothetical protein
MNWVPSAPSFLARDAGSEQQETSKGAIQALELRYVLRVALTPDRQAVGLPDVPMGLHGT